MKGRWLREPRNGCTLLFIHGLFSGSDAAWRSERAYWPDIISGESSLADHGIYLFDYETKIKSASYSLSDASAALNEYFELDGVKSLRQTVFIAHSMGGVITRHFLVSRQKFFLESQHAVGLFFLSSPSLGSHYANLAVKLGLAHHVQINALRFDQDNAWLADLDVQFMNLKESNAFPLFGRELIEADPLFLLPRFLGHRRIVFPISAARYFGEALKIPGSDHFTIAKPIDRGALQHRMLLKFILQNSPPHRSHESTSKHLIPAAQLEDPAASTQSHSRLASRLRGKKVKVLLQDVKRIGSNVEIATDIEAEGTIEIDIKNVST